MFNVITSNVVMLRVVAPSEQLSRENALAYFARVTMVVKKFYNMDFMSLR
jgi:hypothetical protein